MLRDMNRDVARRDALLGITGQQASGGIVRYEDLDGPRLATLIDERFADPDCTQNESPTIAVFLSFLKEYPEVRVYGYAVSPERSDYRVSVEGVTVDLGQVAPSRRAALRAAFARLGETADEKETDGDLLHCWWD
jgi:hypothetical protein